jgi:hypothetical protein
VRTWLNAVPAILVAFGILVMAIAAPQVTRAVRKLAAKEPGPEALSGADAQKLQQRIDDLARQVDALTQKRDALKDSLATISQQANQSQWMLSIVLALAGLLTLAQGAFAFFSAQNYTEQAKDTLKKIEERGKEAEARFPLLSETERVNERAFQRLTAIQAQLDLDQNLYKSSNPIVRQEILSLESFAVTRFLASDGRAPGVVGHLQLLGRFYADKFYIGGDRAIDADFDRALYYYTLVHDRSGLDILTLNDLGWLHMVIAKPPHPEKARTFFEESIAIDANQQRPFYNLGTMEFDAKEFGKARRHLETAAGISNWETAPNKDHASRVHYNLACTYSRLAEQDVTHKPELLKLAAAQLDAAAVDGGTAKETLEGDLKGDLAALNADRDLGPILTKFAGAWAARAAAAKALRS